MFNVLNSKAEKTARQLVSYGTQHLGMPFSTVDSTLEVLANDTQGLVT